MHRWTEAQGMLINVIWLVVRHGATQPLCTRPGHGRVGVVYPVSFEITVDECKARSNHNSITVCTCIMVSMRGKHGPHPALGCPLK